MQMCSDRDYLTFRVNEVAEIEGNDFPWRRAQ